MLFDLRGRGRRRTVRVIYIGLAVLLGVGLVGFGIGGGFGGGGLLSAATNNEGGRSASFAKQIAKYRKLTQQQPQNVGGWEHLTKVLLNEAGGEAYETSTGTPTDERAEVYDEVAQSWDQLHRAETAEARASTLAKQMVLIFGEEGLNKPASAVRSCRSIVAAEPEQRRPTTGSSPSTPTWPETTTSATSPRPRPSRWRRSASACTCKTSSPIKKKSTGKGASTTTTERRPRARRNKAPDARTRASRRRPRRPPPAARRRNERGRMAAQPAGRSGAALCGPLAQPAEQGPLKPKVPGSIPGRPIPSCNPAQAFARLAARRRA